MYPKTMSLYTDLLHITQPRDIRSAPRPARDRPQGPVARRASAGRGPGPQQFQERGSSHGQGVKRPHKYSGRRSSVLSSQPEAVRLSTADGSFGKLCSIIQSERSVQARVPVRGALSELGRRVVLLILAFLVLVDAHRDGLRLLLAFALPFVEGALPAKEHGSTPGFPELRHHSESKRHVA